MNTYIVTISCAILMTIQSLFAQSGIAINEWDKLAKKMIERQQRDSFDPATDEIQGMMRIAAHELAEKNRNQTLKKGISKEWLSRLEPLPKLRYEKEYETPDLLALGGYKKGELTAIGYCMDSLQVNQMLAVHYYLKTEDYDKSLKYLESEKYYHKLLMNIPELKNNNQDVLGLHGSYNDLIKKKIEEQLAHQARMADNQSQGGSPSSTAEPENKIAPDLQRFMKRFKGGTHLFKVTNDDGGGFVSTNDLILEDPKTRKRFSIGYTYGFAKSLGVKVGDNVSVRFSETGEPKSIKNEANGVSHGVENWKASGFGW